MKILLFGMMRSRSTYLADCIAKHYNLVHYFEPYHEPTESINVRHNREIYVSVDDKYTKLEYNDLWAEYLKECNRVTNILKNKDNFIIKVFSNALFNYYKYGEDYAGLKSLVDIEFSDILNINDHYNTKMYDQIFATYRKNKVDLACSYLHGIKTNHQLLYTNKREAKFFSPKGIKLDYNKYYLRDIVFTNILYDISLDLLKQSYPNLIVLEYEDVPTYVKQNFPGVESSYIDTNYNYKKTIINYDEIAEQLEITRKELNEDRIRQLFS